MCFLHKAWCNSTAKKQILISAIIKSFKEPKLPSGPTSQDSKGICRKKNHIMLIPLILSRSLQHRELPAKLQCHLLFHSSLFMNEFGELLWCDPYQNIYAYNCVREDWEYFGRSGSPYTCTMLFLLHQFKTI